MIQDDQIRLISSIILSIPLSFLLPKIQNPYIREIYSFIMGTIIQFYIYGIQIYIVFMMHILMYVLVRLSPAKCGKQVTIVSLVLLSIFHVYRMIVDYGGWSIDISTLMMSNVNKYSLFAYAVQDGRTNQASLNKQQIKQKIDKIPSIYRFLSFCQFLPCASIGTSFPYKYFQDYIQLRNQYVKIPAPWKAIGRDFAVAAFMLVVYFFHITVFPLSYLQSIEFADNGFWYIIYYSMVCVTVIRSKYYFGWKLSMGAIHASGISYQIHSDDTSDFKLIQTCNPQIVETTIHVRQKIANWNMTCQEWLRKCIYERADYKNKMHSQLLTFMISSFWHGFYGGYYISFFLWFCHMFVSQLVFKESKKQNSLWVKVYKKAGFLGKVVLWVTSNVAFVISGTFFQVLSLKRSFQILKSIYFIPFFFYLVVYLLFTFGATKQKRNREGGQKTSGKAQNQPVLVQKDQ